MTFEAQTVAHAEWDLELSFLPMYIPPETIPSRCVYTDPADRNDTTKRLDPTAYHANKIEARRYSYTLSLKVGYCAACAAVHEPDYSCPKFRRLIKDISFAKQAKQAKQ